MRYREQHRNRRYLLHDNTVEQLQACVEEFGDQVSDDSFRVGATVQVDREGRIHGVPVTDIPDTAPGLAGCTRIALRNMNVPDLPLRSDSSEDAASVPAKPMGNEVANPAIVVEFVVLLGEFAAQHGAKTVLYAVTIELVGTIAVVGTQEMLRRRRWQNECQRKLNECLASYLGSRWGDVHGTSRCAMCFKRCDKNGWPSSIQIDDNEFATCQYQ